MSFYSFFFITFILAFSIINSSPLCEENKNLCRYCNYITNLCVICKEPEILIPDETGKCIGKQKCNLGHNYCLECEEEGKLCKNCENNYYRDENGGCTYSEGCEISSKGECLKCKDDFFLIGKEDGFRFCKSKYIDNFKNCKEINYETGICIECNDGYFMTGNHRCIKIKNCKESIFGNCISCYQDFYYNKKEDKCQDKQLNVTLNFAYCKQSLDGEKCEICDDFYYLDENGICIESNYCSESDNLKCKKCKKGYYLSGNNICSDVNNCLFIDRYTFLCNTCEKGYYLDLNDNRCKSNLENDEFKYCKKAYNKICIMCESGYYLGDDSKCTNTKFCSESENGLCEECQKGYYLSLDHICTTVEKCIETFYGSCIECEDGYYFNKLNEKCTKMNEQYLNCKFSCGFGENECCECKKNYYLFANDSLCYDNTKDNIYNKCAFVDDEEKCEECEYGYYLGKGDNKCSKIENCKIAKNENECLECEDLYCLNVKNQECVDSDYLNDIENDKKYISCIKTNKEGTRCEKCIDGYEVNEEGFCVDIDYCEEKEDGKCLKCKDIITIHNYTLCANELFGCLEIIKHNCLRCDNYDNLYECTECKEGYVKDFYGCSKIESHETQQNESE